MDNKKQPLIAHLCMLCAGTCWGLMAPIGKDAMLNGIDGIDLVSFRVLGGALLFWLTSLFTKKEHVPVTSCCWAAPDCLPLSSTNVATPLG